MKINNQNQKPKNQNQPIAFKLTDEIQITDLTDEEMQMIWGGFDQKSNAVSNGWKYGQTWEGATYPWY